MVRVRCIVVNICECFVGHDEPLLSAERCPKASIGYSFTWLHRIFK